MSAMQQSLMSALSPSSNGEWRDYLMDTWVWDSNSTPPEVELSRDSEAAYFYIDPVLQSTGTVAVRGNKGFTDGEHYWEIIFLEPPRGTSVMVGVGTKGAQLRSRPYQYVNLLGIDQESWGLSYKGTSWHNGVSKNFCEPFFDTATVIGVQLDMYKGTLSFYRNGVSLGVAFTGLSADSGPLYPLISSTAAETELALGTRMCRFTSLQGKCLSMIRNCLNNVDSVEILPIPNVMKNELRAL